MPRTLVFHSLEKAGTNSWNAAPILTNSQERYLKADAKTHKSFSLSVNGLSDSVIFDVLLSHHLTPFDIGAGAKGLLPITRNTGAWSSLSPTEIAVKGSATDNAFKNVLGALGTSATPQTYFDRIDTDRKKLTSQVWGDGWLVFMGAGGSNVCAAYAPTSALPQAKTVIDQTLYWTEVATKDEAVYLTGLLNSTAINQVIREFQPVGQFGERHIHKLPLGVTPPYDPTNPAHMDVVAATQRLLGDWNKYKTGNAGTVAALLNPNTSKLHIRRRKIKEILASLPTWNCYEDACKAIYSVA